MTIRVTRRQAVVGTGSVVAGSVASVAGSPFVFAQTWPARTVTTVVPFGAGSGADVITRLVLEDVGRRLGWTIVVENRGGAGGTIGAGLVAKATPDGHTILATGSLASADPLYPNKPYDTVQDFAPVIPLGQQPLVLVTAPSNGLKSLADLIVAAKEKPGALNYASSGVGSVSHFAAERFLASAAIRVQHIPFRGAPDAMTEVLAGRTHFYFGPLAATLPSIEGGSLVALAVSTPQRASALPQVPSTAESGLVDSTYDFVLGLYVPVRTPREVVIRLHREIETTLRTPSVQVRLAKLGVEPMPMTVQAFEAYFKADVEVNARIARLAKIRLQN